MSYSELDGAVADHRISGETIQHGASANVLSSITWWLKRSTVIDFDSALSNLVAICSVCGINCKYDY